MSMQLEELPLLHTKVANGQYYCWVCKCSSYERALCINGNEIVDGL
jgi:hypothetical protein